MYIEDYKIRRYNHVKKGGLGMQNKNITMKNAFDFENVIAEIFHYYNFHVEKESNAHDEADIKATYGNSKYFIEVKYSKSSMMPPSLVIHAASRLHLVSNTFDYQMIPVLVLSGKVTDKLKLQLAQFENLIVIDIANLLYLVKDNDKLKNQLLSVLEFSVNDILPQPIDLSLGIAINANANTLFTEGEDLIRQLNKWNPEETSSVDYENLCYKVLNYLFNDELSLWHRQKKSNADLYRFDLICKIKDGEVSGLWTTILQCFNSKYIIFEFKNYTTSITQKEIYTTDKYLYLKALRGVAILVSCYGSDKNAEKAIKGTLRENGKLILSICNDDLIEMIQRKINNDIPADYLYEKLDNLLIELEK